MAHNKIRREIMGLLAVSVGVDQARLLNKLETAYAFEEQGGALTLCVDWQTFRDRAMKAEIDLMLVKEALNKALTLLGGPVDAPRPPAKPFATSDPVAPVVPAGQHHQDCDRGLCTSGCRISEQEFEVYGDATFTPGDVCIPASATEGEPSGVAVGAAGSEGVGHGG